MSAQFKLEIKVDDVPVNITVEYPKNQGLYAVQALNLAGDGYGPSLLKSLMGQGDQSVIDRLHDAGLDIVDDEEEDDEWDEDDDE